MGLFGCRSIDLSLKQKVPICFKTVGSVTFQNCGKDFVNVSQPTVSQVLSDFTENMVRMASSLIYMPSNSNEMIKTKREFYKVAGFPGVIGCTDGSHIPIIAPHQDEFAYVNHKKFHSINIQGFAILISCFLMSRLSGRGPAMILLFCKLLKWMATLIKKNNYGESWLLGDSGYPLEQGCATFFTGGPLSKILTTSRASHRQICIKL